MNKKEIKQALLDGAQLAYNMFEVRHELHINEEVFTVRVNTALQLKDELDLVPVKQVSHNRFKTDVMIVRNNTYMSQDEIKAKLKKAKNNFSVGEIVELKANKAFNESIIDSINSGETVTAEIESIYDDGSTELINIKSNGILMTWNHTDRPLDQATDKDVENFFKKESQEVIKVGEELYHYKDNNISVYGVASKFNNMAVEGWLKDEEYSVIYSEGYNTYKQAVKAVIDDCIKRFGIGKFEIEQIEFV